MIIGSVGSLIFEMLCAKNQDKSPNVKLIKCDPRIHAPALHAGIENIGRCLTKDDIGKFMVRTAPSKKTHKYDYIPAFITPSLRLFSEVVIQKTVKCNQVKILNVGQGIQIQRGESEEKLDAEFNDANWIEAENFGKIVREKFKPNMPNKTVSCGMKAPRSRL